ncbi:Putative adhesin [Lachnospiraceae bacterium XBB1006]|nr:Putative adhesin [Lachnospiraceae bacterium XBB1006]
MRRKLQQLLCLVLVVVSVSCLIGVYTVQKQRKAERIKHKKEIAKMTALDDWQKEHDMDWDGYFESGGYFGDFGDETSSYDATKVKGIDIKAEYATIHILPSEEDTDHITVFTQIGSDEDAISCTLKDGMLRIIQANLNEETTTEGSYIEVTLPAAKHLNSFSLSQRGGATSVSYVGRVDDVRIHMDDGSYMAEQFHGKKFLADANTANLYLKQMDAGTVSLRLEEGVFRADQMDITKELTVQNRKGTVSTSLKRGYDEYDITAEPQEGSIEFAGEEIQEKITGEHKSPALFLFTKEGTITITTGEE